MGNQATARELPALQKEVTNLKGRLKGAEEQVVGAMERVEQAKKALDEQAAIVKSEEAKWAELHQKLAGERQKLAAEVPGLQAQRDEFARDIGDHPKAAYQSIRIKKGGVGVSKVQGGICSGCRITLPTTLVQRARAGKELVYCGNCGRILYVP
jgi:predicted  nucleic acid-binding Zn-ribbon protein